MTANHQPAGGCTPSSGDPMEARPFIKWPGGKRKLLPALKAHVPKPFLDASCTSSPRYFEPFLGGGALFFHLHYTPTVLGDMNGKLVATYEAVRDEPEAVIAHLQTHPNTEEHYYAVRARNFSVGTRASRAAEFIYANRVGFNGLFRENRAGQFNVPFGRNPGATICDADNLRNVSALLKGVRVVHGDFAATVKDAVAGDLVYCDPPYEPLSPTSSFNSYVAGGFTRQDQVRLRDLASELKARGVHVLISNSSAPLIRQIYGTGFVIQEVQAARSINSDAARRGAVTELIIT